MKNSTMRIFGHTLYLVGLSQGIDVAAYYYPEFTGINHLFCTMVLGILVGAWIMIGYSE